MQTPTFVRSPAPHRGPPCARARSRRSFAALTSADSDEVPDRRSPRPSGSEEEKRGSGVRGVGGGGLPPRGAAASHDEADFAVWESSAGRSWDGTRAQASSGRRARSRGVAESGVALRYNIIYASCHFGMEYGDPSGTPPCPGADPSSVCRVVVRSLQRGAGLAGPPPLWLRAVKNGPGIRGVGGGGLRAAGERSLEWRGVAEWRSPE